MNKFGNKAITSMVVLGSVLATVYGFGGELGIPPDYLEYTEKFLSFLGLITGVTFIKHDQKKIKTLDPKDSV